MKTILFILFFSLPAFAQEYSKLVQELYQDPEERIFVGKFFEILELHKTQDPLMEGAGPNVSEFSLDKIKFAFIQETSETKVDLIFFNWNLEVFEGLEFDSHLTKLYGKKVYVLKGIERQLVGSQGPNRNLLTNFSYIVGSTSSSTRIRLNNPDMIVPEAIANFKPHPGYMDRSHPLRKTLGDKTLVLFSPSKKLFFEQAGVPSEHWPLMEEHLNLQGGFLHVILGMLIHETYHVKDGEDVTNRLAIDRSINEDRKLIVKELSTDPFLKTLIATYIRIVFSISDDLALNRPSEKLGHLKVVIKELQARYPETWKFIWNYEYTEGFAEYVSSQSMIIGGLTSLPQQLSFQKADENNFAYRSGTIAGLYLYCLLKKMPFDQHQDHTHSIWELVINHSDLKNTYEVINDIITKYESYEIDTDEELNRVIEYLESTVMNI